MALYHKRSKEDLVRLYHSGKYTSVTYNIKCDIQTFFGWYGMNVHIFLDTITIYVSGDIVCLEQFNQYAMHTRMNVLRFIFLRDIVVVN
jgi:hypothetical protein